MKSLNRRIEEDGITAEATWRGEPPSYIDASDWDRGASWYNVTLQMDGRVMTVPFGMGSALTDEPTAADVLNCLTSDAATYENARGSFEEWASDLGYDADSRKAERIYKAVAAQTEQLRGFLGDRYDAYLWDTEGL